MVRKTFFAIVLSLSLPVLASSVNGQCCDQGGFVGGGGYGAAAYGGDCGDNGGCRLRGCFSKLLTGSGFYSQNCGRAITTQQAAGLWAGYCSEDCGFQGGGGCGGCGGGCGGCGLLRKLFRGGGCFSGGHSGHAGGYVVDGGYVDSGCGVDGGYVADGGYVGGCGADGGSVAGYGFGGGFVRGGNHGCGGGCILGRIFGGFRGYNGCGCFQGCFGYPGGGCGGFGGGSGAGFGGGSGAGFGGGSGAGFGGGHGGCGCLSRLFGGVRNGAYGALQGAGHLTNGVGHFAYGSVNAVGRKACCLKKLFIGRCGCGAGLSGVGQIGYSSEYFHNAPISTSNNFGFYSQGCGSCGQSSYSGGQTYQSNVAVPQASMSQTYGAPIPQPNCSSSCFVPGASSTMQGSSFSPAGEAVPSQVINEAVGN